MSCRKVMLIVLIVSAFMTERAQSAEVIDDSVIAALDAEMAQAEGGVGARGGADGAKADGLISSIEEEIAGLSTDGEAGSGAGKRPSASFNGQQANAVPKGVVMYGRGSAKTKARAEEIACWNTVWSALCKYVGTDLVKKNSDAVKKRTMSVAKNVIERHEIVEESESDEKYTVKVKAWIGKKSLASEFSDIFPDAFGGGEVNRPAPDWGNEELPVSKDQSVVVVTATGKGETKEEAKKAAFRAAVEKAIGAWVDAESRMEKSELLKDSVNSISNGDIKRCETLDERRESSGLYACKIKAWVEKKAIAPKFKKVFPAAFKDIGEAAGTLHAHRITSQDRAKNAASLMTAELEGVNRIRDWTRLSTVKGRELEEVKNSGGFHSTDAPGKGMYSVQYSMTIDEDAYFKGFLPHFKTVLSSMQEGGTAEGVTISSIPVSGNVGLGGRGGNVSGNTYFVNQIALSGFPGLAIGGKGGNPIRGKGGNPEHFMFDQYKGLSSVQGERTFNIWVLDKMNKDRTVVQCSAYKLPISALLAYWKGLYGELDSPYTMKNRTNFNIRMYEQVEVVLLDEEDDEIAVRVDRVPTMLMTNGHEFTDRNIQDWRTSGDVRALWEKTNVFNSFFVRPMFAHDLGGGRFGYSTEIQRKVYFPLTDSQLGRVKKVKVRFVGGNGN